MSWIKHSLATSSVVLLKTVLDTNFRFASWIASYVAHCYFIKFISVSPRRLFITPQFYKKFTEWCHRFPLDVAQVTCVSIVGGSHKYVLASKDFLAKLDIPVDIVCILDNTRPRSCVGLQCVYFQYFSHWMLQVIQNEGEVIVTYPFTPHSGFKTGWNIQQAVNFADEWWVEPAILADSCECWYVLSCHGSLFCESYICNITINLQSNFLLQA